MNIAEIIDKAALVEFLQKTVLMNSKRDSLETANLKRIEKNIPPLKAGEESKIFASFRCEPKEIEALQENFGKRLEIQTDDKRTFLFFIKRSETIQKKDGSTFQSDPQISWVESSKETTSIQVVFNPDTFRILE